MEAYAALEYRVIMLDAKDVIVTSGDGSGSQGTTQTTAPDIQFPEGP